MHELIKKVEFTKADFDLLHQAIEVFTEHTHSVKAGRGKAIDEIGKLSKTEVGGKFAGIMPDELFEQAKKDFLKEKNI